jgi:hypothetical protein
MDFLTLRLYPGSTMRIVYDAEETVAALINNVAEKLLLEKERIKIIFKGKILERELTLGFYKIEATSVVTVFVEKQRQPKRESPKEMFKKLVRLVNNLEQFEHKEFTEAVHEIHRIAEDPILKKYASINHEVQRTIAEATDYVDSVERPISASTMMFIAKAQDNAFNQFESNVEGMRCLTEAFLKKSKQDDESSDIDCISLSDSDDEEEMRGIIEDGNDLIFFSQGIREESQQLIRFGECHEQKTVIDYKPKISTDPLPLPNGRGSLPFRNQFYYTDNQTVLNGVGGIKGKDYL